MNISDLKNAIVEPGDLSIIDLLMPDGITGAYSHETLDQLRVRYPRAEVVDFDTWMMTKESALLTEPVEISQKHFENALNVLPPVRWNRECGVEAFEFQEHLSGRVTSCFLMFHTDGRCFEVPVIAGTRRCEVIDRVKASKAFAGGAQ